jgi:hypothetical protein
MRIGNRLKMIGVTATLLASGACAAERPATVKEEAADAEREVQVEPTEVSPSDLPTQPSPSETVEPSPSETIEPTESQAPEDPQVGDLVSVGDWDVRVTDILLNADEVIRRANMFNNRPRGQFVLVTYEATYNGRERIADAFYDLTWSFTTTDQKVHDGDSEVTPADNQEWPTEVRAGGTAKSQVVFDLPPAQVKGRHPHG